MLLNDIHELRVELLGENMTFLTDAGVLVKEKWLTLESALLKCLEVNEGETVLDVGWWLWAIGFVVGQGLWSSGDHGRHQ